MFWSEERIDQKFDRVFGNQKRQMAVNSAELPGYRFVDLYNAIERFVSDRNACQKIETQQAEPLTDLLHNVKPEWGRRDIGKAERISWPLGPKEETFFPVDCFWLCPKEKECEPVLLRLTFNKFQHNLKIEVAGVGADIPEKIISDIIKSSAENSIYRNGIIHLAYDAGKKDEYGDVEKPEQLRVNFSNMQPVAGEDIVLGEEHRKLLKRNIIDLNTRRDILKTNNVPTKRGILLYGPPGTGKTFACRHICHQMSDVTRIFVTGASLGNVGAVFSLARLFQPSVIFIEDADLMFTSRESNLYSVTLGELMDQMDGLRSQEDISIVMTTNAIDRLEAALKDRPGRISQCIYMGAPGRDLRLKFITHQLQDHETADLNFDLLVEKTAGATQAFIKEWVFRSVQIACERLESADQKAQLTNADFVDAIEEMQLSQNQSEGQIIGFAMGDR